MNPSNQKQHTGANTHSIEMGKSPIVVHRDNIGICNRQTIVQHIMELELR